MSKLPKTPEAWANHLTNLVYYVMDRNNESRFPINVREIAIDYSKSVFPEAPISKIQGTNTDESFEGMIIPIPNGGGAWGIIYNDGHSSKGRKNFTIAHELGHYLLHREIYPKGKRCSNKDMMDWSSEEAKVEGEANKFAATLLMPLDDYRDQIGLNGKSVNMDLFNSLANRYEVSLSAAILRWLEYTDERAMIVVGKDGFIDWAWSSKPLLKSGIYYKARQQTIEIPVESLAVRKDLSLDNSNGIIHPVGIWNGDEEVTEMAMFTEEYSNMTVSVLVYPKRAKIGYDYVQHDEPDLFDRFASRR